MRDAATGDNHTQYDSGAMAIHFEAIYEQGVLRPLEPLALAEHQRVHVTVDERKLPLSWESAQQPDDSRAESSGLPANRITTQANGLRSTANGWSRMGRSWRQ